MLQHLIDIEPVSDRVMWATWKGTLDLTTICAHIPQAARTREEKEIIYQEIKNRTRKRHRKGPVIVGADFNARIQKQHTITKENISETGHLNQKQQEYKIEQQIY